MMFANLLSIVHLIFRPQGHDINLSIQFVLNCGAGMAGSCHGGYHTGTYELIKEKGFIPFET